MTELERDLSNSDRVTKPILNELVKDMLEVPAYRSPASRLWTIAHRIFQRGSTIEIPPTPASSPMSPGSANGYLTQSPIPLDSNESSNISRPALSSAPTSMFEPLHQRSGDSYHGITIPSIGTHNNSMPCVPPVSKIAAINTERLPSDPTSPRPILDHISSDTSSSSPKTQPDSAPNRKHTGPSLPTLTIEDAESWIQAKKRASGRGSYKKLPDEYLLRNLETRDHVCILEAPEPLSACLRFQGIHH